MRASCDAGEELKLRVKARGTPVRKVLANILNGVWVWWVEGGGGGDDSVVVVFGVGVGTNDASRDAGVLRLVQLSGAAAKRCFTEGIGESARGNSDMAAVEHLMDSNRSIRVVLVICLLLCFSEILLSSRLKESRCSCVTSPVSLFSSL